MNVADALARIEQQKTNAIRANFVKCTKEAAKIVINQNKMAAAPSMAAKKHEHTEKREAKAREAEAKKVAREQNVAEQAMRGATKAGQTGQGIQQPFEHIDPHSHPRPHAVGAFGDALATANNGNRTVHSFQHSSDNGSTGHQGPLPPPSRAAGDAQVDQDALDALILLSGHDNIEK
ncbi:hypothetical protein BS47DRAFT_1387284 [Hydnum rufescens UP504]|uniref:Uncharacterized protein n=1 Tax=Hydnum rufescens UP504 TaxID=1448309 RepID=A0A9P6BAB7_9AGAM|nr:hypothetical protein BS47DRAFT_1387284 [Hydnum rufescens UP504]